MDACLQGENFIAVNNGEICAEKDEISINVPLIGEEYSKVMFLSIRSFTRFHVPITRKYFERISCPFAEVAGVVG